MRTRMATSSRISVAQTPRRTSTRQREHRFYVGISLALLALVLAGFAPTFYLRSREPVLPLIPTVVVHGTIFTSWFVLYAVQTSLAAVGRIRWHRLLGWFGTVLAAAVVISGIYTAIGGARRGHLPVAVPDSYAFLAVPMIDMLVFSTLVIPAILWRNRPATHKRLMLLATFSMIGPPLQRLPLPGPPGALPVLLFLMLTVALGVVERGLFGRLHPALRWGLVWIFLAFPIRAVLTNSLWWHDFAVWLAG